MNINLTIDEVRALESSKSIAEWDAVLKEIWNARDGEYPPDWQGTVVESGLLVKKTKQFADE